jgi:hypothetical protein
LVDLPRHHAGNQAAGRRGRGSGRSQRKEDSEGLVELAQGPGIHLSAGFQSAMLGGKFLGTMPDQDREEAPARGQDVAEHEAA